MPPFYPDWQQWNQGNQYPDRGLRVGPNSWWRAGDPNRQLSPWEGLNYGNASLPMFMPGDNMDQLWGNYSPEQQQTLMNAERKNPFSIFSPQFSDVLSSLQSPINAPNVFGGRDPSMVGRGMFGAGIQTLGFGQGGMSPELRGTMDIINQLQNTATNRAASSAQALASRRGLAGSSVEQFGVGSAAAEAQRPYTEQQGNVLQAEAQRQQQLRDLTARAYFDRSGLENQANLQRGQIEAQLAGQFGGFDFARRQEMARLTSDELASLRNLREAGANRGLQQYLGEQGIAQANQAAETARRNASRGGGFFDSFAPALFGGIGAGIGGPIGGYMGRQAGNALFSSNSGGGSFGGYGYAPYYSGNRLGLY